LERGWATRASQRAVMGPWERITHGATPPAQGAAAGIERAEWMRGIRNEPQSRERLATEVVRRADSSSLRGGE
jgi:hypothetical protein